MGAVGFIEGTALVSVEHLRKSYGSNVAVADVSFAIAAGEVFGLLGPNGAGKTTTLECLEGLRRPDSGRIRVLGMDPVLEGRQMRTRIGVQMQETHLPERMTVSEALDLFASLYPRSIPWTSLLEPLGLADKRHCAFGRLSGGQKQRLFVALALVHDPDIIFLDELTTGLDPQARHAIWDLVKELKERGKTVVLTTHFMEEAERLCERVAIVHRGRIVAMDTPANLVRGSVGAERVAFTALDPWPSEVLANLPLVNRVETSGDHVTVYGGGDEFVTSVLSAVQAAAVRIRDVRVEQPTLEDVFLALTGQPATH